METVLDFLGNPIFGVFILLLMVLIGARKLLFLMFPKFFVASRRSESQYWRIGLLFGLGVAILAVSSLLYAVSPSVRSDFAFLRSGVTEDNSAISNRNELCYKRTECYNIYTVRLRCEDEDDFNECMREKTHGHASKSEDGCGDFKALFDRARVSHAECLFRNTASTLMAPVSTFDRSPTQ